MHKERLDAALKSFGSHPGGDRLRALIEGASPGNLFHIDPDAVAEQWGVSRRAVLEIFLRAVRFGILSMEWVFHCPTCGGIARESLSLAHTQEHDYCPVCRADFQNTLDRNVEVFFSVSPEIALVPQAVKDGFAEAVRSDVVDRGYHNWRTGRTVEGVEILNHQVFRDIFGDDTLPLDQSLEIGSATIVFTDITGSTALYERLGDARAYRLIRDHFGLVFDSIAEFDGVPVKTIGDAVMGVFTNEEAAVRAVFAMTDALERNNRERADGEQLQLKVGMNRGPVIVVTLNNSIDYFGRTVNIAARVQSLSHPNELSLLHDTLAAPGVKRTLQERVSTVVRTRARLKGIRETAEVYRVALRAGEAAKVPRTGSEH